MKKIILNIVFVAIVMQVSAQKHYSKITESTCTCINKLKVALNDSLIDSCMTYAFLEHYEMAQKEIALTDTSLLLSIGVEVSKRMLSDCNKYYAYARNDYAYRNKKYHTPKDSVFTLDAVLLTVEHGDITKLIVENDSLEEVTLLWTESFKGDDKYMNHAEHLNKKFHFEWKKVWYYSPETKSYIEYLQVTKIEPFE